MKTIKRKGNKAKCPYCGFPNVLNNEVDYCPHLYEVIADEKYLYFYFTPENEHSFVLSHMQGK